MSCPECGTDMIRDESRRADRRRRWVAQCGHGSVTEMAEGVVHHDDTAQPAGIVAPHGEIQVSDPSRYQLDCMVSIGGEVRRIVAIDGNTITVAPALSGGATQLSREVADRAASPARPQIVEAINEELRGASGVEHLGDAAQQAANAYWREPIRVWHEPIRVTVDGRELNVSSINVTVENQVSGRRKSKVQIVRAEPELDDTSNKRFFDFEEE
jgi:hypothetical protein